MTYRRLAVLPFALAALGAVVVALCPAGARVDVTQILVVLSKVAGFVGLLAATRAFDRGDYLRRGWALLAASYVGFFARDLVEEISPAGAHAVPDLLRAALVLAGNVCDVVGAWTLARAWRVAGFEQPGSKGARLGVVTAAVLASALLAGHILFVDTRDALHGSLATMDQIPSDVGDLLTLPIIAPVGLTAYAVREGSLKWPWGLLAASLFAWLGYDATYDLPTLLPLDPTVTHVWSEQVHVLAGLLACAAGLAQRRAVADEDDEP